jgi:hypothetical protein
VLVRSLVVGERINFDWKDMSSLISDGKAPKGSSVSSHLGTPFAFTPASAGGSDFAGLHKFADVAMGGFSQN